MTTKKIEIDSAACASSFARVTRRSVLAQPRRSSPSDILSLWHVGAPAGMLLVVVLGVVGCDAAKARVPVSGKVLFDGQPLTTGTIVVAPETDKPAFGAIGPDGRFVLTTEKEGDGCVKGTHRVAVTATDRTNPHQVRWLVPTKYGDLFTSGLTADILGPTQDLVLELKPAWEDPESRILIEQGDAVPNQTQGSTKE